MASPVNTTTGQVYIVGPISLAAGGLGTTDLATDPNADRLVFWDDSAGKLQYLTAGSGLTITGTTITATGVAGSDTQVQFNDGGALAGDSGLVFNKTTNNLSADILSLDSSNKDVILVRDAANQLALRNGTNTQQVNIYNTYTDGSNYERIRIYFETATIAAIGAQNAGTGALTTFRFRNGGGYFDFTGAAIIPDGANTRSVGSASVPWGEGYFEFLYRGTSAAVTASTTQTQGNGALTKEVNNISTCANVNDTVTLPAAQAGKQCIIMNNGAQTLQIFPASGDNLGAGVDTSATLTAGSNRRYIAYDATNWEVV